MLWLHPFKTCTKELDSKPFLDVGFPFLPGDTYAQTHLLEVQTRHILHNGMS